MASGITKEITKNMLEDKICSNCFFHTNKNKPLTVFCMKEVETDYNTCNKWESSEFNDYMIFKGMKFTAQSEVEFAEKEIEKIKIKHNL